MQSPFAVLQFKPKLNSLTKLECNEEDVKEKTNRWSGKVSMIFLADIVVYIVQHSRMKIDFNIAINKKCFALL